MSTPTGPITAHFTWEEARCRCGCVMPRAIQAEVIRTAAWAEGVRAHLGEPMRISSWYRCPSYNRRVGGRPASQHLQGKAIDFGAKTLAPREVQRRCAQLYPSLIRGLGRYPGFTHIDRRATAPATWTA